MSRPFRNSDRASAPFALSPLAALCAQWFGASVLVVASGSAAAQATEATATLPEVTVNAKAEPALKAPYAGGQVARGGSLGLLGAKDTLDTPFSTVNFTSLLLEDQQARSLADVVTNDASIRMTTASAGFDDTFQIRGFAVGAGDVGVNGLYGLISSSRVPAQLIERVEVLKGPGALINGIAPGGSVGGGINVVTKRAGDEPLTRFTTVYEGKSNIGLQVDVGRRFGEGNAWGIRVNGLVKGGETSINGGNVKSNFGSVGLDYRGSRLRWSLDAINQRSDTDNFRPQISLAGGNAISAIPAPPDARSNFYPGTSLQQRDSTVLTRLEYDVTDSLTAYAAVGYRDGKNNQIFPVSDRNNPVDAAGNFRVGNSYYDSYSKTTSGTAGLRWNFNTGAIGHTLTAGVSGLKQEAGNAYIAQPGNIPSNIYNPSPLPVITLARTDPQKASDTTLTSIAVADTMSFIEGRVLVTVGAREQNVGIKNVSSATGYRASTLTPLGGVVFRLRENVSLYGNYSEGLSSGTTVGPTYANRGTVLAPYKSKQVEVGTKVDLGRVTTTAALYQIKRPAAAVDASNIYSYSGEQRNRGLELSAFGEIQRGLRGMVSATFVDPELSKTAGGVFQGNDAPGVPNKTLSANLDWDTPWVRGLSLNGRAIYTAGSYLNTANSAKFDGWTRFDVGARYRTEISGKPVVFRANIENLFDKNYWLTTGTYVTVGSPRTLVLSAQIDF